MTSSTTQPDAPYVLRDHAAGIVTLTLNRGDKFNPLSEEMMTALQTELDNIAADPSVRVDTARASVSMRFTAAASSARFCALAPSCATSSSSRLASSMRDCNSFSAIVRSRSTAVARRS